MAQESNPLLDSLNLFTFLILLTQNSQLLPGNTRNPDLHNNVLEISKKFNKNGKSPCKNNDKEKKLENNNLKEELKKHTFWDELFKHTRKVNYVKIKIMADGPESKITGYLANVHNDFITLVKNGEKINIPINKILTLKLENPDKSNVKRKKLSKKNKEGNVFTDNNEINSKEYHQLQLPYEDMIFLPKIVSET